MQKRREGCGERRGEEEWKGCTVPHHLHKQEECYFPPHELEETNVQ